MRDMNVHGQKDFAAGKMAVWRIVRGAELRIGEIRDYIGAVCERIAEEFDDGVFFRRRGQSGRLSILQPRTELVVGGGNVGHQLAEVHGFRMRTKSVLIRRHGLCDRDRELAQRGKVLGVFAGGV